MNYSEIILTAISKMISERDYHVTIYKLEQKTGLNRGNIYAYFKKLREGVNRL